MHKNMKPWPLGLLDAVVSDGSVGSQRTDPPADLLLAVEYIVNFTLSDRETKVVTAYYRDSLTHSQIGAMMGISTERVRQIKAKAIRKLRHPSRFIFLRDGLQGGIAYYRNREYRMRYSAGYREGYTSASSKSLLPEQINRSGVPVQDAAVHRPIDELDLGVRSYNALKRANINTVEELLETPIEKLRYLRNVGEKTITEILAALKSHGYDY